MDAWRFRQYKMALLDSIDISVRPITVGAKHKATKTFFQYIVCFIKR